MFEFCGVFDFGLLFFCCCWGFFCGVFFLGGGVWGLCGVFVCRLLLYINISFLFNFCWLYRNRLQLTNLIFWDLNLICFYA